MRKRSILTLTVCVVCCAGAYGRYAEWNKAAKPPVSLRSALDLAEAELKGEGTEYYCIGASLANTFRGGDWELHFSSKEGKEMWISVGADRRPKKSEQAFQY